MPHPWKLFSLHFVENPWIWNSHMKVYIQQRKNKKISFLDNLFFTFLLQYEDFWIEAASLLFRKLQFTNNLLFDNTTSLQIEGMEGLKRSSNQEVWDSVIKGWVYGSSKMFDIQGRSRKKQDNRFLIFFPLNSTSVPFWWMVVCTRECSFTALITLFESWISNLDRVPDRTENQASEKILLNYCVMNTNELLNDLTHINFCDVV